MIDPSPAPRHRRTVLRFGRSQAAEKRTAGRHAARFPVEPVPLSPVDGPAAQAEPLPPSSVDGPAAQAEPQVEPPFVPAQAPLRQPEIYCWS